MSRIQIDEVREIARLARLSLEEAEIAEMRVHLDSILGYVETLQRIDVSGTEPLTHAVPFDCPLRPDQVEAPLPLEAALANAPRREGCFFQVPRVIEPGSGEREPR